MENNKLITGNVLGSLIRFAIPVLAAMFLQSLYGAVDLMVVGQFADTADVSGVSSGSVLMQTITMIITGLTIGVTVYVGQRIGENNKKEAGKAIGASIVLFGIIGTIFSIFLLLGNEVIANMLHTPAEAYEQTCDYIKVCGVGTVFIVFYNLIGAIFRGIGDSKTPLITVCIACACNIIADVVFVAEFQLGAMGAAMATVISQALSVVISVVLISRRQLSFEFTRKYIRADKRLIGCELKIGIPLALQEFLVGISFVVIQTVVNSLGVNESAGVGIAEKVCAFLMLVPSAFSESISAFVAQNIGAGKKDRAKQSLWYGIAASFVLAIFIGTFTFLRGDLLAGIFTKDGLLIVQAHEYLKAYAIDVFLTAILFCFIGYYNGNGYTLFVMIQGLVGALCVRIPVVFLVSRFQEATLFHIGLCTPASSMAQIAMCLIFYAVMQKK